MTSRRAYPAGRFFRGPPGMNNQIAFALGFLIVLDLIEYMAFWR